MNKIIFRIYETYVFMVYLICLSICYLFRIKKNVWLLSERGTDARDNGYVFYRYLKEHHPEINVKYIISRKSADRGKIDSEDIINHGSIRHYLYFISSRFLISSHVMGYAPETRLFIRLDMYNLAKVRGKRIFLQHGIIYSEDYSKSNKHHLNLDLFVCGAKPEYKSLLETSYYDEKVLKLVGLPRYDNYHIDANSSKNFILVMPTWRYYFSHYPEKDFSKTDYCVNWNRILTDKKLNDELGRRNMKIIFYPHYEFQKFIGCFHGGNNVTIADFNHYDVGTLLKDCNMLLTDYSSVFFDVHYMGKPVIYYQFDRNMFWKYHHKPGWHDFENGFGYMNENVDEVIRELIKEINNGFVVEKKYRDRIRKCFAFDDAGNCERIYNEIMELEK